jgi:hypothetical protein
VTRAILARKVSKGLLVQLARKVSKGLLVQLARKVSKGLLVQLAQRVTKAIRAILEYQRPITLYQQSKKIYAREVYI